MRIGKCEEHLKIKIKIFKQILVKYVKMYYLNLVLKRFPFKKVGLRKNYNSNLFYTIPKVSSKTKINLKIYNLLEWNQLKHQMKSYVNNMRKEKLNK